jgi:N utilization substance protein A
VDSRSETEFAAEEAEHCYEEEEVQGRCAAVLSNGRRCPNASLPGSRYCGLETHQALANIATDNVADLNTPAGESASDDAGGDEDALALAHDGETDAAPETPTAGSAENASSADAQLGSEAPAERSQDEVSIETANTEETPAEEPAP